MPEKVCGCFCGGLFFFVTEIPRKHNGKGFHQGSNHPEENPSGFEGAGGKLQRVSDLVAPAGEERSLPAAASAPPAHEVKGWKGRTALPMPPPDGVALVVFPPPVKCGVFHRLEETDWTQNKRRAQGRDSESVRY